MHNAYEELFDRRATGLVQLGADNCELRFATDDLESIMERLIRSDVAYVQEPGSSILDAASIRLRDPDGHLIRIDKHLPVELTRHVLCCEPMLAIAEQCVAEVH